MYDEMKLYIMIVCMQLRRYTSLYVGFYLAEYCYNASYTHMHTHNTLVDENHHPGR